MKYDARAGVNKCPCGGHASRFGEALMSSIMCEDCNESLYGVGLPFDFDLAEWWNKGARGQVWTRKEVIRENINFLSNHLPICLKAAAEYSKTGDIGTRLYSFSEHRWRNMLKQVIGSRR